MRLLGVLVLSAAVLTAPSVRAAIELVGGVDAAARDAASAASQYEAVAAITGARWSADGDEPFAVDVASLASLGNAGAASDRNPFAWTLLLIAFAGLTAVFAGKKSGGRGLIA